MENVWAGGRDFSERQMEQTIEFPVSNVQQATLAHVEVKPKTDSFVQIISDVHWGWLLGGVVCIVIGGLVVFILLLKLTPLGKIVSKAWNGLAAMFKALIEWKPKGK